MRNRVGRTLLQAFFAVGLAIVMLPAANGADSPRRFVRSQAREVRVSARVDLVVVGGNEGGIAAAWTAAKAGASVLIVNGNYFFSDDVSAKARYWLAADERPNSEFSRALFGDRSERQTEIVPAEYKKAIEKLLLDAGVRFQFNSRPAGVLVDGSGEVAGVVTANKAGLQAVVAKAVIDATPTAAVARMAGAATTPWPEDKVVVSRVCYGADVAGGRKIGKFCEYSLEVPMAEGSWTERCRAEVLLREKFNRVDAKKAHAHAMHMVEPVSIVSESRQSGVLGQDAESLDLDVCRPRGIAHLYVLSQSADVRRDYAEKLTRPVFLADLGVRIGNLVHRQTQSRLMPSEVSVRPLDAAAFVEGTDVAEVLTGHRRYVRVDLKTVRQPETSVPVWGEYDVVVVGGGTAGIPAAIAAARNGAKVLIVEMLGLLGGNRELGTPGYWKGYPYGFNRLAWRAAEAFEEARKADVDIWYNTLACGAVKRADRVAGVVVATPLGRGAVLGKIVIDASGDADVCAAAGAEFQYVNDGDLCLQEASFRCLDLYANVLPLDHADVHSLTMHHVLARQAGKQDIWDFYPMVGLRETRLIRGDHVIDIPDQILRRTYRDLIAVSWSAYDPHGYHDSDYIYAGLMPLTKHETKPGFATDIPLRSLLPAGLDGILVVGRCHSVTHDVQASVRMNADLINEGYAAGCVAAQAARTDTPLRQIDLGPIQDHLAEIGNISREDRLQRCIDMPEPSDEQLDAAARDPSTKVALALLLRDGRRSLPLLKASFASEPTLVKAKALCVLKDNTAVEYLAAWLPKQPLGEGTAYQWDAFLSVSDVESVMWLLGAARDPRAVAPLVEKLRQCGTGGTSFSHIRAITRALGRIGSPAAAPALCGFLKREGVRGHVDVAGNPQSLKAESFVKSYIELYTAGALVRCGDHDGLGKEILTAYLDDWRGIFVRYAGHVLNEPAAETSSK
ncbi:MAG: FAD-dependent oxidoreductase [Rhodopirellula sp.]|nr:FAD-dependent oxidoreductase [Rhodopirellula sp.]